MMSDTKVDRQKGLILRIVITWLCVFLLSGFLIATRSSANSVTMSIIPEVPKTGEPIVATFNINNSSDKPVTTEYELYVNRQLVQSGRTTVDAQASSRYQYAYQNSLERGEQVNFVLRTSSDSGSFDKMVSLPAYPPQLMSSFVSFAAFSTSVMSTMISMEYFNATFGTSRAINTGVIVSLILITLLIFLELTQAVTAGRRTTIISSYRVSFSTVSTILFIIFIGMVFTKLVMIMTT